MKLLLDSMGGTNTGSTFYDEGALRIIQNGFRYPFLLIIDDKNQSRIENVK